MNMMFTIERERGYRNNFPLKNQFNKDNSLNKKITEGDHAAQQSVPNTLSSINSVGQGESPWFQPSEEPHSQEYSPYN